MSLCDRLVNSFCRVSVIVLGLEAREQLQRLVHRHKGSSEKWYP